VCVWGVGLDSEARPSYLKCFVLRHKWTQSVSSSYSGNSWGAVAEADAIGKKQLK